MHSYIAIQRANLILTWLQDNSLADCMLIHVYRQEQKWITEPSSMDVRISHSTCR